RYLGRTPGGMGQRPDGGAEAARSEAARPAALGGNPWRDARFRSLAAFNALCLFAQIGLIAHLVSLLAPHLGAQGAGLAMALATLCAMGGRVVLGRVLRPGVDRRRAAAVNLTIQFVGLALLLAAGGSVPLLLAGVVLFGVGLGNATTLPPLIAQQDFPESEVPRIVALIVASGQAVYAFAPALFGLARELGPEAFFLFGMAVQVVAGLAVMRRARGAA
ncbi:MFS transporter, partial [Falsiroseomonas oryziterrae]|uniref:MFS transporter n=1 Tax=Falsiroseomonas oryziterrae TaxID=2911368 RepID=UPI001F334ABC